MRDVIGQRRLMERLGAQAIRGDAAHAYGLSGPRSIGKYTAALRLAQTLNCEARERVAGGCGTCRSCKKIDGGTHPDVLVVTRQPDKSYIVIEQLREMQRDLALRPLEGRARVVIIDDVADVFDVAQDALLKTLEEPPSHAVLLLLTTTPARLHPTILSRLQPLPFRLVPTAELAAALHGRQVKDADVHAAAAGGRPGLALTLAADERAARSRLALEAELYRVLSSGLTDRFAWAATLADDGDRVRAIEERFAHWSELLRDAALAADGTNVRALRPHRAEESRLLAASVSVRELVDGALLVERLRRDIAYYNANPRVTLELFALRAPYVAELKGVLA